MEYFFDRRSLTKSFSYEWREGSCIVRFQCDSTATDGSPSHLSCYTLDLEAASWCDVLRSPNNIFVGLRPGPSATEHWAEDLPATAETPADILAFVESSRSWLQLRGRLAQSLDMPAEGLELIQRRLLPLIQDAIWKARLLEHCGLWICVVAKVNTEMVCENEEDLQRESRGLIPAAELESRAAGPDVDSLSSSDDLLALDADAVNYEDGVFTDWYEFPATSGASKKVIEKYLRVERVRQSDKDPKDERLAIDGLCTICLSEIREDPDSKSASASPSVPASASSSTSTAGEAGVAGTLPCDHAFHRECITKWLEVNKICPLCKVRLPDLDEDEEEE